jgi:hypothetical protein
MVEGIWGIQPGLTRQGRNIAPVALFVGSPITLSGAGIVAGIVAENGATGQER